MCLIESILFLLALFYFIYILTLYSGFKKSLVLSKTLPEFSEFPFVSIVIPFYNEEKSLKSCLIALNNLNYPKDKFEVVLSNDGSTDSSLAIINNIQLNLSISISIVNSSPDRKNCGKNAALHAALEASKGKIIFSTDADCEVGTNWLSKIVPMFDNTTGVVCGPVLYKKNTEQNLFMKIQSLDFCSMSIVSAAYSGLGSPMNANANNLAYRKIAVQEIGGFKSLPAEKITIADDDVLVQMISAKKKWKVKSILDLESVTYSDPAWSFKEFMLRRIRWSTSTKYFVSKASLIPLALVLLFYMSLLWVPIAALLLPNTFLGMAFILWGAKLIPDYLILKAGTKTLGKSYLMKYFLPAEPFQVFYIVFSVFLGRLFFKE